MRVSINAQGRMTDIEKVEGWRRSVTQCGHGASVRQRAMARSCGVRLIPVQADSFCIRPALGV
ncbi:hypothetical protein LL253_16270 [Sphingobium soli]|uniref:Uncharacterized protein n=1 Tax=Sphingobium soli TaxID=1591116 RepID=A0ABS8H860_9SPHN|nr:hypothetical protein [Sphingobium soli]